MRSVFFSILASLWVTSTPSVGFAVELVMVEREGCHYCIRWKNDVGPIYPKTQAGQFAPLRIIDIDETRADPTPYKSPIIYTPTFVLMNDGAEVSRMEGYASEDFFWGVLEMTLERETDFEGTQ